MDVYTTHLMGTLFWIINEVVQLWSVSTEIIIMRNMIAFCLAFICILINFLNNNCMGRMSLAVGRCHQIIGLCIKLVCVVMLIRVFSSAVGSRISIEKIFMTNRVSLMTDRLLGSAFNKKGRLPALLRCLFEVKKLKYI